MKPTLFSNKSFLIKISFLVAINLLFIVDVFSQAGQKWGTNGNNTTTGDFIGTTNNEDLIFKTNNTTAFKIKANGNLIIKSLDNQGTGIVTFDNNGKIQPLVFNGNSNEVLYANGTWGVLPNLPSLSWQQNGSDIYYLNGKVGIGTTNPLVNLDVIGDARISNNLYVGGGIIITDKVNANTEVKTAAINADSIKMDSTKAVYGFSNFKNDVKLDSKLQVVGDARINGNLNVNGSFTFGNTHTLSYYPANPTTPQLFGWGIPTSVIGSVIPQLIQCQSSNTVTGGTSNLFLGKIQCFGNNLTPTGSYNIMTMGYDGANGVIDVSGDNTNGGTVHGTTGPDLLINYNCGKNIYMCTGAMGGIVATGKNFEVGNPDRNENIAVNIRATEQTGIFMTTNHTADNNYNTKLAVNRNFTKALAVYNTTSEIETFVVYGNGTTGIGTNTPSAKLEITNSNNTAIPGLKVSSSYINTALNAEIPNIISQVDSDSRKAFVVSNGNGTYTENFVVFGDGHVFARDIKVTLDQFQHPDFVFEKNYDLKSLKEVELYINTNKHLPGVPSAAEVKQEKGITLGEMSEIQLQKIEELTLYIIDLNKKLEDLKNTVDIQKTQINELQKK